jgi:hypothetical protein
MVLISKKVNSFYNIVDTLKLYNFNYEIRHFNGTLIGKYHPIDDKIFLLYGSISLWTVDIKPMKNFLVFSNYFYQPGLGYITAIPCEIITIQRAWRKWFLKVRKNKLDPLKRELMEYIYHPSRLSFNPDD